MRKLMCFSIGFGACCGLCLWVLPVKGIQITAAVAAAVCGLLLFFGKKPGLQALGIAMAGVCIGACWYGIYHGVYLSVPASLDGEVRTAAIRTTDYSYETSYGIAVDGQIQLEGKSYSVKVYLDQKTPLEPGYTVTGPFRFEMTVKEEMNYHSSKGIFLLAYQKDEVQTARAENVIWRDRISHLRQQIRERITACFPEDAYPFALALLLGDTSRLDYETDTNLKVSGIRHVVAVSGLHVSILFTLLGMATFRRRFLMSPLGIVLLLVFAALAGFSPSVVRACIMSGLMLLAMLVEREYDGASALSFAVLVMLICNPLVIGSVSFQLSVASVAGILLFGGPVKAWLESVLLTPGKKKKAQRGKVWLISSLSISFSAMVLTTPLCAYYFGMVSLVGPLTNLLTLWVVSGIFYGILGVCLLAPVWTSGAGMLGSLTAWPIRYVLKFAQWMADLPLAAVYTQSVFVVYWLIFVYILLFAFLLTKRRRPAQLICCIILGLCAALIPSWTNASGEVRMTVLDVGQGQCILLESGGRTYMVDCGGDSDEKTADLAAAHLLSRGITRLDGLILTHLDRDHAGAAKHFLTRMDTDLLILPDEPSGFQDGDAGKILYVSQDLILEGEKTVITIFTPDFPGTANEKSICVLFDTEKCDILITGDRDGFGERMLLRKAKLSEVDVLIAGHHGSRHSTCEELLAAVSPEIVCISAGKDNPFGHPDPETLKRLNRFECKVYRTDLQGTITIRR